MTGEEIARLNVERWFFGYVMQYGYWAGFKALVEMRAKLNEYNARGIEELFNLPKEAEKKE